MKKTKSRLDPENWLGQNAEYTDVKIERDEQTQMQTDTLENFVEIPGAVDERNKDGR